jgi:hypothetical protein
MIKSVNNYPVSTLLDVEINLVYEIPRYQREYTWGRWQWDTLLDDLLENQNNYFLGSIICINQASDSHETQKLELVDGQQRMTTLSLLLAAVYRVFSLLSDLDLDLQLELRNLKHRLVLKKNTEQPRLIPQVQNYNQHDYFNVFCQAGLLNDIDPAPNAGNRRVVKAYRHFVERIDEYLQAFESKPAALLVLLEKVNSATLVKIDVGSHSDAYTLFESLNNRGVPLTAIDLIKNKVLAKLEGLQSGSIDKHYNSWKKVIQALGDDYAVQERFFRQYYNGFKRDLKNVVSVPVATKSNLMLVYEKLINSEPQQFLEDMKRLSDLYAKLMCYRQIEGQPQFARALRSLERVQGASAYLLLMVLLDKRETLRLDCQQLTVLVEFLVSFFVRRNTTDLPPTRDLTRIFMDIADAVRDLQSNDILGRIEKELISHSASDEQFRISLQGPIYEENKGVCRFVLCALEEEHMTRESWVDLWMLNDKGKYIWTIEHIFPQGDNIPVSWVDMIADGDASLALKYRDEYAHCLGNLTISGYNSALGNKSFEDKQHRTDNKGRPVGYNNGLSLNDQLINEGSWTVEKIEARTGELVERILGKYALGNK